MGSRDGKGGGIQGIGSQNLLGPFHAHSHSPYQFGKDMPCKPNMSQQGVELLGLSHGFELCLDTMNNTKSQGKSKALDL